MGIHRPETLTYEIQRRSDFEYVERSWSGREYVDELPENVNSRPRQLFYCVRSISKGGKSSYSGDSNRFITGGSFGLPFTESFANMDYDDGHYWHSINDGSAGISTIQLYLTTMEEPPSSHLQTPARTRCSTHPEYRSKVQTIPSHFPLLACQKFRHAARSNGFKRKRTVRARQDFLISQRIPIRPDGKRELFCLTNSRMRTTSL